MMTDKYSYVNLLEVEAIAVDGDCKYYFNEYGTVKEVSEELNRLNNENNQLKVENHFIKQKLNSLEHDIREEIQYAEKSGICSVMSLKVLLEELE